MAGNAIDQRSSQQRDDDQEDREAAPNPGN
jgi:hypothetical protein